MGQEALARANSKGIARALWGLSMQKAASPGDTVLRGALSFFLVFTLLLCNRSSNHIGLFSIFGDKQRHHCDADGEEVGTVNAVTKAADGTSWTANGASMSSVRYTTSSQLPVSTHHHHHEALL